MVVCFCAVWNNPLRLGLGFETTASRASLNCIVLYCIVLYCIVLYCIVLYCIVLYCIVLYCIVLYCLLVCLFACLSSNSICRNRCIRVHTNNVCRQVNSIAIASRDYLPLLRPFPPPLSPLLSFPSPLPLPSSPSRPLSPSLPSSPSVRSVYVATRLWGQCSWIPCCGVSVEYPAVTSV